jgi:transposase-like protein
VVAVGVDKSGNKHVLGWQLGSTENETVCRDLIRKLIDAGLDVDAQYLFVLDGGKGLRNAIKLVFGVHSIVQRCQEHKIRDVEAYLPRKLRSRFRLKMQAAFNQNTFKKASDRLQKIRRELSNISEPAANSFTEGLDELLTLHRLGIHGGVRESLRTTNIIESAFARLRQKTRNVSNWSDSQQIDRWLGLFLPQVEKGFHQLPGFRQLAKLGRAVNKLQTALQTPKQ